MHSALLNTSNRLCAVDARLAVSAAVAGGDVRLDGPNLADPERVRVGGLRDVRAGGGVLEEGLSLQDAASHDGRSSPRQRAAAGRNKPTSFLHGARQINADSAFLRGDV